MVEPVPTPQTVKAELVYPRQLVGVLPVVLYYVNVVGGREEARKGRRLRIP
jgi:hypothetical protein